MQAFNSLTRVCHTFTSLLRNGTSSHIIVCFWAWHCIFSYTEWEIPDSKMMPLNLLLFTGLPLRQKVLELPTVTQHHAHR